MLFETIQIEGFVVVVIGICTAIVLIGNAVRTIREAARPAKDLVERVERLEQKVDGDWQFRKDQEDFNELLLKSVRQLMKYEMDKDDKSGLAAMEAEIDTYLMRHTVHN